MPLLSNICLPYRSGAGSIHMSVDESDNQSTTELACRLCDGSLLPRFSLAILGKHDVQYLECNDCGALQTEQPFWLDEAYGNKNLSILDTGAAQRNIQKVAACFLVSKLLDLKNVIDVGGGDGLLCRLLRDYGINCYIKDKYATPTYAQGFTEQNFDVTDLVIGIEVLEHLPNPKLDLREFFSYKPKAVLMTTALYKKQKRDWWYFSPESGQHVFFYTKKALKLIAAEYDYRLVISGGFILFVKNISFTKRLLTMLMLNRITYRLMRGIVALLPTPGAWSDHLLQKRRQH